MQSYFPLKFGDAGQYELSKDSFDHIVFGETAVRPLNTPTGKVQETALSGGLHTYAGWKNFLALHPKIAHLMEFRWGIHDAWWFARELQNGVITLKIPRRLFTKNAAGITQQPDNYYKSGYLWKTLFPSIYTEDDIIGAIGEALQNIDRELSDSITTGNPDGVLYGYSALDDPLTAMLIRVQVRGNQILSAFPAWDQPLTGNNGKPYSHFHSISFLMAESVVDFASFRPEYGPVFKNNRFSSDALLAATPQFIKSRRRRSLAGPVNARNSTRAESLRRFAERATLADLEVIDNYLADYPCAKDPFAVQYGIYRHLLDELVRWPELFNASQITENIGECLWVLGYCDIKFNTRRAVDAMVRFLGQALVHTGGLNTLMFKALIGDMITIAIDHVDPTALRDVLAALATSPCRATLYTEFDLHAFLPHTGSDESDLLSTAELKLTVDHLLEFIAFNLGENYLLVFDKDRRLEFAREAISHNDQWKLAHDVMAKLAPRDFDFFMPDVLDLSKLTTQVPPAENDLIVITRDYGRMMVMMRQRIVMEDPAAYKANLEDFEPGTDAYAVLYRQKHKYLYIKYMHVRMLMMVKTYADQVRYVKLSSACWEALERLPKERIPMPRRIPAYIGASQTDESGRLMLVAEMDDVFGQSGNPPDDDLERSGK